MPPNSDDIILTNFEESLTQAALSSSTIVNYLADLRTFLRWGQCEIDSDFTLLIVNQEHIRLYRHHLTGNLNRAASTVNRHLMALKKFFTFALRMGMISINPMTGVALVQDDDSAMLQPLAPADINRLLEAARNGPRAGLVRRDVAILELLVYAGLRVSEVTNLGKDDLIFDHPGVRLKVCYQQDDSKTRYLPLSTAICRTLTDYLAIRPQTDKTDCLFLSQRGQSISERTVQRIVRDCARAAGLEGVSAQTLRRTFALQLFRETNDLDLVSERLGHQSKAITAQYLLVNEMTSLERQI